MTLPIGRRVTAADGTTSTVHTRLHMKHAGEGNRAWMNAVQKWNAKHNMARRQARGGADFDELMRQRDVELYPKLVVTGWDDCFATDNSLVPFDEESCREFLAALPDWIMDEVRLYAVQAANFLPDDAPDEADIAETAGN